MKHNWFRAQWKEVILKAVVQGNYYSVMKSITPAHSVVQRTEVNNESKTHFGFPFLLELLKIHIRKLH